MKHLAVNTIKLILNCLYKICKLAYSRENAVLFLSRQSDKASLDYQILKEEFEAKGFSTYFVIGKLEKGQFVSYAFRVLKEIRLLALCKICFLDGYDPVVSMLDLRCEKLDDEEDAFLRQANLQNCFPVLPVVFQLWHAFGSFKKFGYQSVGAREGRSIEAAKLFDMHRNYSWIICSGELCRKPFAEAFRYPIERVLPLGRPELDDLISRAECPSCVPAHEKKPRILFAPTLRRSSCSSHPFRDLHENGEWAALSSIAEVQWAFHPFEDSSGSAEATREILYGSDCVITDYSSIVYEAYLLRKRIFFYVPDIEEYRISPGLNDDPSELCAGDVFVSPRDLIEAIRCWIEGKRLPGPYPSDSFAERGLSSKGRQGTRVKEIVDFAISCLDAS